MSLEFIEIGYGEALQFGVPQGIYYRAQQQDEIESLRQQLVAALAACELKDEALAAWGNLTTTEWEFIAKALAIQPDDAALKAWIGEPTDWRFTTSSGTHYTDDKRDWLDGYGIESVTPLYSPKEMK